MPGLAAAGFQAALENQQCVVYAFVDVIDFISASSCREVPEAIS